MTFDTITRIKEQFDQAFRQARLWSESAPAAGASVPRADVSQTRDEYRIRVDLPGVERGDIEVAADSGAITVNARRERPDAPSLRLVRAERAAGKFHRQIPLPSDADFEQTSAHLSEGVLTIVVAKRPRREIRRIEVTVN